MIQLVPLSGLEIVSVDIGPHEYKMHSHGGFSVICVTSGAKEFFWKNETLVVKEGEIAVANPEETHGCRGQHGQEWSHSTWYVSASLVRELLEIDPDSATPQLSSPVIRSPEVFDTLVSRHRELRHDQRMETQEAAFETLRTFFEEFKRGDLHAIRLTKPSSEARLQDALAFMTAHIDQEISLDAVALAASVSRSQIIREFRKSFGVPPGVHLRNIRIRTAVQRLRAGEPPIDVAISCGFSDQSHLTRTLRSALGMTPKQIIALDTDDKHGPTI